MIFPGAAMPFGMVKLSPDNRRERQAGSGRRAMTTKSARILGFSHIHSWTMSGLLMMPTTGPLKLVQGPESGSPESFRSHFRHETETASPGYYAVTLDDYKIRAELTTTTRAGFQRYTFPQADQARILLVLNVPGEYANGRKECRHPPGEQHGDRRGIGADQRPTIYTFQKYKLHFVVRFSKPFDSMGGWVGANITPDTKEITGQGDVGAFANYHTTEGEVIRGQERDFPGEHRAGAAEPGHGNESLRVGLRRGAQECPRHLEQSAEEHRSGRRFGHRPDEVLHQLLPLLCGDDDLQRRERQVCGPHRAASSNSRIPNRRCWAATPSGTPSGI